MDRWREKLAVVTGASSGIGAAISEALVREGLQVVGLARREDKVKELSDRLQGLPGNLHPIKADVTVEEDLISAFKSATEKFGPVHILVNNAGVARPVNLVDGKTEDFRKVLDTNLLAVAVATREAVQDMLSNNVDGHIVNINSTLGHQVSMLPMSNVYPASKFGITAMTETLRRELIGLGKNIKVTSISPGYVKTEISKGFMQFEQMRELESVAPHLEGKDVANCVLFALGTPPHAQVTELTIRPTGEPL